MHTSIAFSYGVALNGLLCADVPLRTYTLTLSVNVSVMRHVRHCCTMLLLCFSLGVWSTIFAEILVLFIFSTTNVANGGIHIARHKNDWITVILVPVF